jgi:hypothetical protein
VRCQLHLQLILLGVAGLAASCGRGSSASSNPAPRYELSCDSSDTSVQSTLFCVRTDTRNGDVRVLELSKLPVSDGASASVESSNGTYQTVCDSTDTPEVSQFRCVRLNTTSGETIVLDLSKLPKLP